MFIIVGPIIDDDDTTTAEVLTDKECGEALECETIKEVTQTINKHAEYNLVPDDTAIYYAIDIESRCLHSFKAEIIPAITVKTTILN